MAFGALISCTPLVDPPSEIYTTVNTPLPQAALPFKDGTIAIQWPQIYGVKDYRVELKIGTTFQNLNRVDDPDVVSDEGMTIFQFFGPANGMMMVLIAGQLLTPGLTNELRIKAIAKTGYRDSAFSQPIRMSTSSIRIEQSLGSPNFTVGRSKDNPDSQVELYWGSIPKATAYQIVYWESVGSREKKKELVFGVNDPRTEALTIKFLDYHTLYIFKIRALSNDTAGPWSISLNATTTKAKPRNRVDLDLLIAEIESVKNRNGITDLSGIDTSLIEDMYGLFKGKAKFNGISEWNTSKVRDMGSLFEGATEFNENISRWDTSKVESMDDMFKNAALFNQNIGAWTVSKVKTMGGMFSQALAFNQDIGAWNVSEVTDMSQMFMGATAFDQSISPWNVENVIDMRQMFMGATAFNKAIIGHWKAYNVTNMSQMFRNATAFNNNSRPVFDWDIPNVTDMSQMLRNARAFSLNLSKWTISNTINITNMLTDAGIAGQTDKHPRVLP